MHVIDDRADPICQRDRGTRTGNIRSQSCDESASARCKELCRPLDGGIECCRLACDPRVLHLSASPLKTDTSAGRSVVVFDIGEALILVWRAFQRSAFAGRLPMDDVLYLLCQLEVLIGNSFGGVILQPDFDPGVGCGDIRMVPSGFGKMTNSVDHHERAFPAIGAIFAADPTVFEIPVRQAAFQSLLYLFVGIGSLIVGFGHRRSLCWAFPLLVSIVPSRLPIGIG